MERDIFKKAVGILFKKNDRKRFAFIGDHRSVFPLEEMCRALEVSRSGYYAFKKRPKSQRRVDNERLLIEIKRVFWLNDRNYGSHSPRIWEQVAS